MEARRGQLTGSQLRLRLPAMTPYLCHDFKTPRTDTSKRLPPTFKMVPIALYLSLIGGTYFMTMDWLAYKRAEADQKQAAETKAKHEEVTARLQTERVKLDQETAKAESVAKWIEGARNLQPVNVAIARSVPPEVRLSDLSLERSDQMPSNLSLTVRIKGGGVQEVGMIETSLARLNYRSFSPQQSKDGDAIEYRSTLVRQDQ